MKQLKEKEVRVLFIFLGLRAFLILVKILPWNNLFLPLRVKLDLFDDSQWETFMYLINRGLALFGTFFPS